MISSIYYTNRASYYDSDQYNTLNINEIDNILNTKTSENDKPEDIKKILVLKREIVSEQCKFNSNASIRLSFAGIDFKGVDFSNLDLSHVDFTNADLSGANMTNTKLNGADLSGAKLTNIIWNNVDITDVTIELDDIVMLPLSDKDKYIKLNACVEKLKTYDVLHQEEKAINLFRESLDIENKVQARFAQLDNKQLQILLPCLYVEAVHKINPIIAYNKKDVGHCVNNEDDNALMIKGYAKFLSALNDTFNNHKNIQHDEKVARIVSSIEDLITLLVAPNAMYNNGRSGFQTHNTTMYKFEDAFNKIENGKLTLNTLECEIAMSIDAKGFVVINGIADFSIENKKNIFIILLMN